MTFPEQKNDQFSALAPPGSIGRRLNARKLRRLGVRPVQPRHLSRAGCAARAEGGGNGEVAASGRTCSPGGCKRCKISLSVCIYTDRCNPADRENPGHRRSGSACRGISTPFAPATRRISSPATGSCARSSLRSWTSSWSVATWSTASPAFGAITATTNSIPPVPRC